MTQAPDASLAIADYRSLDRQRVPKLVGKVRKFRDCVLAHEKAVRLDHCKGGNSRFTRSKQKKAYVWGYMEQSRVELDALNARVAELEACTTELEKQLEHSASQLRVGESK